MKHPVRHLLSVALAAAVIAVAACNGAAPATPANAPAGLAGEISFYTSEGPEQLSSVKGVIDSFQKLHPGATIQLVNIPDDGEFDKKIAALFAAGIPPDVFTINYRRFGPFAIKGALQPLDQYLADSQVVKAGDYYPAALDAFKLKGRQYCIPQNLSSLAVYYNQSLFEAARLPLPKAGWTWDEFLNDAKALTQDTNGDGRIDQYGLGVQPSALRLVAFIWAHGGDIVDNADAPTRLTIDSGPALEAFQWFVNLQVKERVVPSKADEATEGDLSRFEHGTLGMYLNSRVETPELRATIGDRFQWDVAPMPVDKNTATVLHSDGYCMSSGSTNMDLAWAFTEFATGPDGQKQIVLTGRTVPSLQAVAQSPAFLVSAEPPASSQIYLDMALYIRRVPIMTTWLEVEEVLNEEIKRAFYGDATVEEAAQSAVNSTLEYFKLNLKDLGTP